MASWERFLGARSWLQFPGESASILLPNSHHFCHDQATIGLRSGHDRGHGRSSMAVRSNGSNSTTLALRSRFDRTAIAVRSNRDHGVLP